MVVVFGRSLLQWFCGCCLMLSQSGGCFSKNVRNVVVKYGNTVFPSLLTNMERGEISLYEVTRLLFCAV